MDNSVFGIYDESQLDLDYFKTLIQQNENRTSYLEACDIKLKMEQKDFNPQGKCRTVVDLMPIQRSSSTPLTRLRRTRRISAWW